MIGLAMPNGQTVVLIMAVSLIILLMVIGYKKILKNFSKDHLSLEKYCVLYSLETEVAEGKIDFYFTTEEPRKVTFEILDENYQTLKVIFDKECEKGGNIVPFDTTTLENGNYFYCLKTYNQKTMKKVTVRNR